MNQYVALLRGINVGGNNLIKMPALRACFEALGFGNVATYIQSGNVLFSARSLEHVALTRRIEAALSKSLACRSRIVVRSLEQMRAIIDGAPKGFGHRPAGYRYDVMFLKEPLSVGEAMRSVTVNPGVDRVSSGEGVLYFLGWSARRHKAISVASSPRRPTST